jgi:hypothetical protein
MSDIQRYDAWPQEWPFEDKNGDFVTYEDHIKIVKELEAKLEKIEGAWGMALYGDLEHGVASLNEKAQLMFHEGYPNIAAFGSDLVRILYEGEKE